MLGIRKSYRIEEGIVKIFFEAGEAWVIPLTDDIIRFYIPQWKKNYHSKAVEENKASGITFQVRDEVEHLEIITKSLIVCVSDDFYVDIFDIHGKLLCSDYRGNRKPRFQLSEKMVELMKLEGHEVVQQENCNYPIQVVKRMEGDESFYGLGDKAGCLDKRHYAYEMWNSDIPDAHTEALPALYKSIPFFITLRQECVYGIFFDNTYHTYFDMGKEREEYFFFGAYQGELDYYFINGSTMSKVVSNYTYLTGRTPLPQLFTLGYHQSRWGYETAEDVRGVALKYRDLQLPIDTIHFDIDYMDNYKVFTWDEEAFGQPGELIHELGKMGYKFVTIIDPGVKIENDYMMFEEGIQQGYFVQAPSGEIYHNVVWPGESVFPDFGNPAVRNWWGDNQKFLVDMGVRGVWNDMNEPASFRGPLEDDVIFTDEDQLSDHAAMHNVYGHLMAKATYEGLVKYDGRRPFVITRACYSGSQKYATAWTGDNQSLWEHLRMSIPQMCNLGLSGMAFIGTDVGGFGADVTPELLVRWVQVGCFSPLFRNHSSKGSIRQEPWLFGKQVLEIYRKYLNLRYHLLPYYYDLFWECEQTGLPMIRPLILHYQQDEVAKNLNGEFLVGEKLLVAPVVEAGMTQKLVYLPAGIWYDYWTMEKHTGPCWVNREAKLDMCPMYVRAGMILPGYEPMQYVGEHEMDNLILDIYPGNGRYVHHQDNGEDFAYRHGEYNAYEIVILGDGTLKFELVHHGYEKIYRTITIRCRGQEKQFAFDGKPLTIWL